MGWSLRHWGSDSTFLHALLIFTARKGRHRTLEVYVHPAIKGKATPVSLRATQKAHEGRFFRFCLVSPMELESKDQGLIVIG